MQPKSLNKNLGTINDEVLITSSGVEHYEKCTLSLNICCKTSSDTYFKPLILTGGHAGRCNPSPRSLPWGLMGDEVLASIPAVRHHGKCIPSLQCLLEGIVVGCKPSLQPLWEAIMAKGKLPSILIVEQLRKCYLDLISAVGHHDRYSPNQFLL